MKFLQRYRNIFATLPSFGLDLSDKSVKFVWLKPDNLSLKRFGQEAVPPGLVVGGDIKDINGLIMFLRNLVKKYRLPRFVAVSLPEEKGFVRTIQLPPMEPAEVREAIRWEIEANIPIPLAEALFDFEIVPSPAKLDHLDVNVVVFPRGLTDAYLDVFLDSGMVPTVLELESQAVVRAVIPPDMVEKDAVVICDFGATRTTITIFSHSAVRFTASRTISSDSLTQDIARTMKLPVEVAEERKRAVGLAGSGEGKAIFEVILPSLRLLAKEIRDAVEFYQSHAQHVHHLTPRISRVLLCGGGANLHGLSNFLSRELGILAQRANPWVNILPWPPSEVPALSYQASLSYATALGLALRGAKLPILS